MTECLGHATSAAQKQKRVSSPGDSIRFLTPPTVETVGYHLPRPRRSDSVGAAYPQFPLWANQCRPAERDSGATAMCLLCMTVRGQSAEPQIPFDKLRAGSPLVRRGRLDRDDTAKGESHNVGRN